MTVTGKAYGKFPLALINAETNWASNSIRMGLHTVSYVPNQDTDDYWNDATNEIADSGYTAGGQALASKTATYDAPSNTVTLDCADVVWSSVSFTVRVATVHDHTPSTDATRPLYCYNLSSADVVSTAGNFTVQINASGLLTFTAA